MLALLGAEIGYEVERESLAQQRKGIWQKALLAVLVKKHCAVSNEWIANRLAMGRKRRTAPECIRNSSMS